METMTDTPETDGIVEQCYRQINVPTNPIPADFARKLERERDEWRNEHDRVVREFQHRLVVIGISVIEATSYPENARAMPPATGQDHGK